MKNVSLPVNVLRITTVRQKKILLSVKKEVYSYLMVPRWSRDGRGDGCEAIRL